MTATVAPAVAANGARVRELLTASTVDHGWARELEDLVYGPPPTDDAGLVRLAAWYHGAVFDSAERSAYARLRSPRSDFLMWVARNACLSASVMGRMVPPSSMWLAAATTDSGAPFT